MFCRSNKCQVVIFWCCSIDGSKNRNWRTAITAFLLTLRLSSAFKRSSYRYIKLLFKTAELGWFFHYVNIEHNSTISAFKLDVGVLSYFSCTFKIFFVPHKLELFTRSFFMTSCFLSISFQLKENYILEASIEKYERRSFLKPESRITKLGSWKKKKTRVTINFRMVKNWRNDVANHEKLLIILMINYNFGALDESSWMIWYGKAYQMLQMYGSQ